MRRRTMTVADLARLANIDVDEALVRLWDSGLERFEAPTDVVPRRELAEAQEALGVPTSSNLQNPAYWQRVLGVDEDGLRAALADLGLEWSTGSRRLPKGAIAKLTRRRPKGPKEAPELPPTAAEAVEANREPPPVAWHTIGHVREVRLLHEAEVVAIHDALVADFAKEDPIDPPGVKCLDLLSSAIFREHTAFEGSDKYRSAEMAAAALLHALVHNHPFHNGNKRAGLVSMLVLLDENGLMLVVTDDELFKFIVRVTQHQIVPRTWPELADREVLHIAQWISDNSRSVERGDRSVQWRRLKRILAGHGCQWHHPPGVGNRLNVVRVSESRTRLGIRQRHVYRSQVKFGDDGRDAEVTTVRKLRKDLGLDEEHGYDSASFYAGAEAIPSDFIVRYRRTLQRLAKL